MNRHLTSRWTNMVILFALCVACADKKASEQEATVDPGQLACDNVGHAEFQLDASAVPESAPTLLPSQSPLAVTLPVAPHGYEGYLAIQGPGALLLFTDTAAMVSSLTRGSETANRLPAPAPNANCPQAIPEHFDLDLEADRYYLHIGPSALPTLWIGLTDAAGHAHE